MKPSLCSYCSPVYSVLYARMLISNIRRVLSRRIISEENIRQIYISAIKCKQDDPSDRNNKKDAASKKLDSLLQSIIKDNLVASPNEEVTINLPKPRVNFRAKKEAVKSEVKKAKNLGTKIVEAAKEVAETIPGNKKETEAQLLQKLLYKNADLKEEIVKAAPTLNLSEVISGMKVEKTDKPKVMTTSIPKGNMDKPRTRPKRKEDFRGSVGRVDVFSGKLLGLFKSSPPSFQDEITLETWQNCCNREINLSVTHPPSNIYEQMILWTERGILWKFPIDNEQGLEEEKKTYFADHVFLDVHLEGWCPQSGPVRNFMELVCVGLSRNYWLTAKEKKDHIMWYKEYFSDKNSLLKEIGAGEILVQEPSVNA